MQFRTEITMVPLKNITPYEHNNKKHDDVQIERLAAHIAAVGWDQPIVVDESGVIVKGHGRLLAAKKLKLKQVPVIVATGLTPEQVRAARIADNKLSDMAEWDNENLRLELEALMDSSVDLESLGYTGDQLELLLHGSTDAADDFEFDPRDKSDSDELKLGIKIMCATPDDHAVLFDELKERGLKVSVC